MVGVDPGLSRWASVIIRVFVGGRQAGRQAERREDADSFEDGVWPHEPGTGSL